MSFPIVCYKCCLKRNPKERFKKHKLKEKFICGVCDKESDTVAKEIL